MQPPKDVVEWDPQEDEADVSTDTVGREEQAEEEASSIGSPSRPKPFTNLFMFLLVY